MNQSVSQRPEDILNIAALELFTKDRENSLSQKVNSVFINDIYTLSLKPLLKKCINLPTPSNIQERTIFMGELLALWIYSKKHTVNSWEYEPTLPDGKTPDFRINNKVYVEIYSPIDDLPESVRQRMKTDKITGLETTGVFEVNGVFDKNSIVKKIKEKSLKYMRIPITILVVTHASTLTSDIVRACATASIHPSHNVEYYHGDRRMYPKELGL